MLKLISVLIGRDAQSPVVHRIRLLAGLCAVAVIFVGTGSALLSSFWTVGILGGARTTFEDWRLKRTSPRWASGVWSAYALAWLGMILLRRTDEWIHITDILGVASSIAYAGAKAGCALLGCCRAQRWPGKRGRARRGAALQIIEVIATLALLGISVAIANLYGERLAIWLLLSGHGLVRTYSGMARFPLRSKFSIVVDPGEGLVIFAGLVLGIYAAVRP